MIDKELQTYHTYHRFLRILLTICGCWYMPTKSSKSTYYWSVCVLLLLLLYGLMNLHMCYIFRYNLEIMMKNVGIALATIGAILKVTIFLINRDSLINYHRTLNDLFEEELARNKNIRTIMFSSLRSTSRMAYIYSALLIMLMVAYFMPVYLFILRHFRLTNYTLPPLPVSRGYGHFWTVPDNFLYYFHLLFETCSASLNCITACSLDSVFGFYVYQFASTMHAMTFRLMNPLPSEKFSDILRTCVKKHQKLFQCRNILEHIYGTIVFWHIITNAVVLCSLIYETLTVSFNVTNLFGSLSYAVIKLLQTFIYAWYGTLLTNASEDFRKGIYFGEWFNSGLDRHIKTNVILIMMQKPMTINAFYTPIDIVMFTNFVNATMTYFFLLQSLGNNDK